MPHDGRRFNGGVREGVGRPWVRVGLPEPTRQAIRALTGARGWGRGEAAAARLIAEWSERELAAYESERGVEGKDRRGR